MWEVATLGNIPTSTYFVTCVAFFRKGGRHRAVRFCPIRDFKNRQRGGLENAKTESGAGASTAY